MKKINRNTDENKDALKQYEELLKKNMIKSTTMISPDNYDEKYMKIEFNSDDDLQLNKKLQFYNVIIVVRSVFHNLLFLSFLR